MDRDERCRLGLDNRSRFSLLPDDDVLQRNRLRITSADPSSGLNSWTVTPTTEVPTGLTAVACPATDLCVAVDPEGAVVVSTNPSQAGSWVIVDGVLPAATGSIACPSVTLCVVMRKHQPDAGKQRSGVPPVAPDNVAGEMLIVAAGGARGEP